MEITLRQRVETLLALTDECKPPDDNGHPERCVCDECAVNAAKADASLRAMCRLAELAPAVLRGMDERGMDERGDGLLSRSRPRSLRRLR